MIPIATSARRESLMGHLGWALCNHLVHGQLTRQTLECIVGMSYDDYLFFHGHIVAQRPSLWAIMTLRDDTVPQIEDAISQSAPSAFISLPRVAVIYNEKYRGIATPYVMADATTNRHTRAIMAVWN